MNPMPTSLQASKHGHLQAFIPSITDSSGNERALAGIVAYQQDRGLNAKSQARVEIELRPRLWELSQSSDNRVFQGLSIPDTSSAATRPNGVRQAWIPSLRASRVSRGNSKRIFTNSNWITSKSSPSGNKSPRNPLRQRCGICIRWRLWRI